MVRKKTKQGRFDSEFLFLKKGGGSAVGQWSFILSLVLFLIKCWLASSQTGSIGRATRQEVEEG